MEEKKETPKKLVLTIPRDQWMRGTVKSETDRSSVLWSEGLSTLEYALARTAGVQIGEGDAQRRATAEDFPIRGVLTPEGRLLTGLLYVENDEGHIFEEGRESRIKELFAIVNVEVVFT